jgi:hypothetical protein
MTVPIATTSGRSGLAPQLAISYDSGSGNGQFALGWNLSFPEITRKSDKGYRSIRTPRNRMSSPSPAPKISCYAPTDKKISSG